MESYDPASFSNFAEVRVIHYDIEWNVNFDLQRLEGTVILTCKVEKNTNKIILDGRDLCIKSISMDGKDVTFNWTNEEVLGMKLVVETGPIVEEETVVLKIVYLTINQPRALQFMNKLQTTDKKAPFLFSQCQAIHARSILPCMDTPSVKSTYTAKVTVPRGLTCLMSAISGATVTDCRGTTFSFKQDVAIPTYLIAITAGKLEKRNISDRCAVWAEPSIVDSAFWEFADTGNFLQTAEELVGPYVWGRYDMIVLPATFPYGGMENPCLTFITPTLLAGDRSLVTTVAHEIAHSWTGNLVTNANWEHFWLNEGFTVFVERKILGRIHGEVTRQFESELGWEVGLVSAMKDLGPDNEFTKLVQNHKGVDPDDAFSRIPYEKGSAFLLAIEQALGDPARFEEFLRKYIEKYAYKTATSDIWKQELEEFFSDRKEALSSIDWDRWLHQPGLPPKPNFDSTLMKACTDLCDQWLSPYPPTEDSAFVKMSPRQKVALLSQLRNSNRFEISKMVQLTDLYKLNETKNCDLQFHWLMLGLETKWEDIVEPAMSFALRIGRMKFCNPIYKMLFEWPLTSQKAVEQFKNNIIYMHPITATTVGKLVPK